MSSSTNQGTLRRPRARAGLSTSKVADRDLCPDIEVFVAGVQRSLEALERSVALTASNPEDLNP
jgi:hypothetical protein